MNWGVVLGVVATISVAAISVIGGLVTARSGRTASPYDSIVKRVMDLERQRETDVSKIETLQRKVGELEDRRAEDQTEIAGLQRRIAGVMDDRDDVVGHVIAVYSWVRSGAKPPPPPIPQHLADMIPQWSPSDVTESTKSDDDYPTD